MRHEIAVPATLALVYRAWSHKSLTPLGIVAAVATAVVHALHPWSLPFTLLCVFFLLGSQATKVKADVKANLTLSSSGSSGGEGPRTHVQVLANSLSASLLILLHLSLLSRSQSSTTTTTNTAPTCLPHGGPSLLLATGIVSNYAVTAADTLSSELGILSRTPPHLITNPFRAVPPGTNGGVTPVGLLAGAAGSFAIALASAALLPFCPMTPGPVGRVLFANEIRGWAPSDKMLWVLGITVWGLLGSVLDSLLGATLQASVLDSKSGRIVEGPGGTKVLVHSGSTFGVQNDPVRTRQGKGGKPGAAATANDEARHNDSRMILSGADLLDNNQINLLMAATMSVGGMAVASYVYDVPFSSIFS